MFGIFIRLFLFSFFFFFWEKGTWEKVPGEKFLAAL
jgi:hypothetical protein